MGPHASQKMAHPLFLLLILSSCGSVAASGRNVMAEYTAGQQFQLSFIPDHVTPGFTKNVTVRCASGSGGGGSSSCSSESRLREIFRMRIMKKAAAGWSLVAERRDNENSARTELHGSVRSQVRGLVRDAFLEITWPAAVDEVFGVYRCDVTGFDDSSNVVTETSVEMDLMKRSVDGAFLLGLMEENKRETEETRQELKEARQELEETQQELKETKEDFKTLNENVGTELETLNNEHEALKAKLEELRRKEVSLLSESLVAWPAGHYALLQPKTGCPVDLAFFGGSHGFHKLHTESSSNSESDQHSSALPSLMKFVAASQSFMTLNFCEVTREFNSEPWPQGSFCVHKLTHSPCPAGFNEGKVKVDLEDDNYATEGMNRVTEVGIDTFVYCCQHSGAPEIAISLPTRSPFLLYRHGGTCQQVDGMKVSQEFFQVDTEDTRNADSVCDDNCPDVEKVETTMKFHLCHYTQLNF